MIIIASKEEHELLQRLRSISSIEKVDGLSATVIDLKKQITDLEIQKSKKQEEFDRQERDLRHMIGLEKKRHEFENDQTKKETSLSIREGNLTAERKRFEDQLKFNTERYEKMEIYIKDMFASVLERLPNINTELKLQRGRK